MTGIAHDLIRLIDRFVDGTDTSLRAAHEMEAILLENFTEEDWFDEASLALAQYSPGGSDRHYYREADVSEVLKAVKADLAREVP